MCPAFNDPAILSRTAAQRMPSGGCGVIRGDGLERGPLVDVRPDRVSGEAAYLAVRSFAPVGPDGRRGRRPLATRLRPIRR
jgi:hypothetical protein